MAEKAVNGIGEGWVLKKHVGEVSLWYNDKKACWGVYISDGPDRWLMQAIVKTEKEANKFFDEVTDMVKEIPE
jgi:hypothetical protein